MNYTDLSLKVERHVQNYFHSRNNSRLPYHNLEHTLMVVEAASQGVPSIVVAGLDNAATELIEDGVNGFVAPSASPEDLARAIVQVSERGQGLRESTAAWFEAHAGKLSLDGSVATVSRLLETRADSG